MVGVGRRCWLVLQYRAAFVPLLKQLSQRIARLVLAYTYFSLLISQSSVRAFALANACERVAEDFPKVVKKYLLKLAAPSYEKLSACIRPSCRGMAKNSCCTPPPIRYAKLH
jgi:hypothetical protein